MNNRDRFRLVWLSLLFLLAGCGRSQSVGQEQPPTVIIAAPSAGQRIQAGEEVAILVTASDAQGVVRVELGVDEVLLYTIENPSPAANIPFAVQQTWIAAMPGSHSVMAVAYNTAGAASSAAVVSVTVVGTGETPAPTPSPEPEGSGVVATATWTPIAIASQEPPLPSATPSLPPPTATSEPPPEGGSDGTRPSAPGPITGFEQFGTWRQGDQPNGTFTQSSEQIHSGSYAGKLAYSFSTSGNDFMVFLQSHKLGGEPNQIRAWVYGDASQHYLNVWVRDAEGETWQFPLGQVKHSGWQEMLAWLDPGAAWPAGHIDGPSNGTVDYPIDFRALVLDDVPDSYAGSGAVYVDDLSSGETSAPAPALTSSPKPTADSTVDFRANADAVTSGNCTELRWDVDNVREVYLNGEGVVGQGNRKVCPTATTTYRLRVAFLDGSAQVYEITIKVNSP